MTVKPKIPLRSLMRIGEAMRQQYDDVVTQPLPPRLRELMARLELAWGLEPV